VSVVVSDQCRHSVSCVPHFAFMILTSLGDCACLCVYVSSLVLSCHVVLCHQLHSPDAPPAVGRSGRREERGLGGSGLSGEAYRAAANPAANSFAQRSWLYADDPSLTYRREGLPPAPDEAFGNSIVLGSTAARSTFGIKSVLSADGVLKHKYGIVD